MQGNETMLRWEKYTRTRWMPKMPHGAGVNILMVTTKIGKAQ